MAGPVFYSDEFKNAARPFPPYYDGKLLIYEWMRGWIMAVTMDKEGNYVSMERFMPDHRFANPMDMEFSPDGDLYVLEYGTLWFQGHWGFQYYAQEIGAKPLDVTRSVVDNGDVLVVPKSAPNIFVIPEGALRLQMPLLSGLPM